MFCDTCHWYTAGESICPHCGAAQSPKKKADMFNLPGDVSVLDDAFMNAPLVDAPMPVIGTPPPTPGPPSPPAPRPASVTPSPVSGFCGRCVAKTGAGKFCSRCGSPLI